MKEGVGHRESGIRNKIEEKSLFPANQQPQARRLEPAAPGPPLAHALQRILLESLPEEEFA